MKLKQELAEIEDKLANMPSESSVGQYFAWLNRLVAENQENVLYKTTYRPMVQQEEKARAEHRPFLTVLTRTQGKRPEMLRETLLSLVGQSDQDFELVLIGHKLEENQKAMVEQIIHEQPEMLRRKIRFVELDHGNRTTPLNVGFALAHGQYVAVLDDDDIVMDHWVESFHQAAKGHEGMVLHAYVFAQDWETVTTDTGRNALRAVAAPSTIYCEKFDILRQMRMNHCPLLGLAFPVYYFHEMGFIFDEALTTTEDWDYLMRLSAFAGVIDIEEGTSIYRLWKNAENSYTSHDKSEWKRNDRLIQDKIMDMALIIPQGSRKSVSQESVNAICEQQEYKNRLISGCMLYLNHGRDFSQKETLVEVAHVDGENFDVCFHLSETDTANLQEVRFDPCEEGMIILENVRAYAEYQDGMVDILNGNQCRCNGVEMGEVICFLKKDPWMIWSVRPEKKLNLFRITGKVRTDMSDETVQKAYNAMENVKFQLFYSAQETDFDESNSVCVNIPCGPFEATFPINTDQRITNLRIDPGEKANCVLSNVRVQLITTDGIVKSEKKRAKAINGKQVGDVYVFDRDDPQMIWQLQGESLSEVKISGIFNYSSDDLIEELVQATCYPINETQFQLFYSTQKMHFCEEQSTHISVPYGRFDVAFPIETDHPITNLRIDPGEKANCVLSNVQVQLITTDGVVKSENQKAKLINGKQVGDIYIFDRDDPQMIWQLQGESLSAIKISGVFASLRVETELD